MDDSNFTNRPNDKSLLLPLNVSSYNNLYINISNNAYGLSIEIPEQQLDIVTGDSWEIYYAPVLSNDKMGKEILVASNNVSGSLDDYEAPGIITPADFFPKVTHRIIKLWYVITKKCGEKIASQAIEQCLATQIRW